METVHMTLVEAGDALYRQARFVLSTVMNCPDKEEAQDLCTYMCVASLAAGAMYVASRIPDREMAFHEAIIAIKGMRRVEEKNGHVGRLLQPLSDAILNRLIEDLSCE